MIRASVELAASAVTSTSSSPFSLIVPAKTGSPDSLSTGMLSPVTGAWLMLELPATTTPSSGTRSPGRMRTMARSGTSPTGCAGHSALLCRTSAVSGAIAISPVMAWRARSTARASINSAIAYSAMTIAASAHCPMNTAPVTATLISALMFSRPASNAKMPFL